MIDTEYKKVRRKYAEYAVAYSKETDQLIKRKRMLEFSGATADEWFDLANDFLADGGRANHAYCMAEYRKCGGEIEPMEFHYEEPTEPEMPEWMERKDLS